MDKIIKLDGRVVHLQRSLTSEQKQAVGLLSIGTFLEYFDLMLYIHMAILLNDLFFEPSDSFTSSLRVAFTFCSTYVLRPVGALLFGWIGDNIGRKSTVIITTFMMAFSCVVMATLPTYAQIGITASWIVTICRILQGISSMGERIGAELYLTEATKPPIQYPVVALVTVCGSIGTVAALGLASLVLNYGFNWRLAFWIGAIVAVVGSIARRTLRETPEFADAKRRFKNVFKKHNEPFTSIEQKFMSSDKVPLKTFFCLFLIQCAWPAGFYFVYIHCAIIFQNQFGYSHEQVINNNFFVSLSDLVAAVTVAYLSYYIFPLKIQKILIAVFTFVILLSPYLLDNITAPYQLTIIQVVLVMFAPGVFPGMPIFFKYFPVFKRFTCGSLAYAFAKMFISIIVAFGITYLTDYFGNKGVLIIMLPICVGYVYGIMYFSRLEKIKS